MLEVRNTPKGRLVLHISNLEAETIDAAVNGLRVGLVESHRVEEVAREEADANGMLKLELQLIDVRELRNIGDAGGASGRSEKARRMIATCDLLDALGVPNGAKAIAIALAKHWDERLRFRYGKHDNPSTIKRWRIERSRPPRLGDAARRDRRRMQADVCRLRAQFAVQTVCQGLSIIDGYSAAMGEIERVNSGHLLGSALPDLPLERFSYATFARDCRAVEVCVGRTSAWRCHRRS